MAAAATRALGRGRIRAGRWSEWPSLGVEISAQQIINFRQPRRALDRSLRRQPIPAAPWTGQTAFILARMVASSLERYGARLWSRVARALGIVSVCTRSVGSSLLLLLLLLWSDLVSKSEAARKN